MTFLSDVSLLFARLLLLFRLTVLAFFLLLCLLNSGVLFLLLFVGFSVLPALDDGHLVVVVEVDDLLPEYPSLVLESLKLLTALFVLALLLANGHQTLSEMLDFSLDVVQSLIRCVNLIVALLWLVLRLLSRLDIGLLGLLLLDGLLGGAFFHQ